MIRLDLMVKFQNHLLQSNFSKLFTINTLMGEICGECNELPGGGFLTTGWGEDVRFDQSCLFKQTQYLLIFLLSGGLYMKTYPSHISTSWRVCFASVFLIATSCFSQKSSGANSPGLVQVFIYLSGQQRNLYIHLNPQITFSSFYLV